ncbi:MAG TPA: radical SAM protein [Steroidobacteraceae bacterium]|nr:radical SAM protein [Steroidobacteraceae bacterium]
MSAAPDAAAGGARDDWLYTPAGDPRGYIQPHTLAELWFHTGTACNLACPFCLEGSRPGDRRLERVSFADLQPFIDEAHALGVRQFSFTGGEPFIVRDLLRILDYALERAPCLVLTNGVDAVTRRLPKLAALQGRAHPLALRVSIDYPQAARHDAGRGAGNFRKAWEALELLHGAGLRVSVARQMQPGEDRAAIEQAYRQLLAAHRLPQDLNIVAFPDFGPPGARPAVPDVTENCMRQYQTEASRREFMCAYSKMVVKRDGRMRVYACTLVDDDPHYDQGGSLDESLARRVMLRHQRCFSCFKYGASCSESRGH